jgi:tripartite-type tricarboxylate transporter receptor subunit TctC
MTTSRTPHSLTRRHLLASASLLAASPLPTSLLAQTAEGKPIKFILPVGAGSGVDGITRAASSALGKALGSSIVIDNQPGAGGVVGTQLLTKAAPDGLTLGMVSNNHVIYPSVLKSLPFDPIKDITPIAVIGSTPMVLVINPKLQNANGTPVKTMAELVALLKAHPGKYNYASSGNGTILHLAAEIMKEATGTFATHIPYRGFGPMLADMVDFGVGALPAVIGHIKSGSLRALAIASSTRAVAAPDIPTGVEQGFGKFLVEGWFAAVGPAKMSAEQVKRIHAAISLAFANDEVKAAMAKQGNAIAIQSPESSAAFFQSELQKYAATVKRAGVKPD